MKYVKIKFMDLKEGQIFWKNHCDFACDSSEIVIKGGFPTWSIGGKVLSNAFGQHEIVYAKSIINTGDTMVDLKAELAEINSKRIQSNADIEALQANRNKLDAEHAALEKQIADSAVTYSIGDRFKEGEGEKYILSRLEPEKVVFIGLSSGNRFTEYCTVNNDVLISKKEFSKISGSGKFHRYWDARKQCKV